jgi:hypothetical protein
MPRRALSLAIVCPLVLCASTALADRVAVLPARGGTDDGARNAAQAEILSSLLALGHTPVPDDQVGAALRGIADGTTDTADEYKAVAATTGADWVVVATVEPAVATTRIEVAAYLASNGRIESVAREIERGQSPRQTREVLAVLVRPEGVGVGELPWERNAVPAVARPQAPAQVAGAPPPAAPAAPPIANLVVMDYPFERHDVWPAYSAGHRLAVSALTGFAVAVARPDGAIGSGASMVLGARLAYALGDRGIELFADAGGNLVGPPGGWLGAGARLMLTPWMKQVGNRMSALSIHMGPELTLGAFFRGGSSAVAVAGGATYKSALETHAALGAALDVVFGVSPTFQVEAQLGNLRWIPGSEGSLVLLGATLGAGLRF